MEDQDLIAATLDGQTDSYAALVDRYYAGLYNHLYLMVKDPDWADDLAQEAFIRAYQALGRYDATYRFSTWLYRIGTNRALQELRRRRAVSLDDVPELPGSHDVAAAAMAKERQATVRAAVERLPLKYQTVISLYYWHDQAYEEIAVTLAVPVGTVKTWLYRAKQQLKHILGSDEWID